MIDPLVVLKGKLPSSVTEVLSRKGLVIYKQVRYIQSSDPGYNKDNIVKFDVEGQL